MLFTGACSSLATLTSRSRAEQHRYLVEQKNRTTVPAAFELLTFAEFLALPSLPVEYRPSDWEMVRRYSQRGVSLEGYLAEVVQWYDGLTYGRLPWQGDVHLHLRERPQPGCFPEGPRSGQLVAEVTPYFQPPETGWSYAVLLELCQRQARVRLSGFLLHDYPHEQTVGKWRASAWEIHPVTKIEVWDPVGQVWRPLP